MYKRTLVSLALIGVAATVHAQSSVTLYGAVDLALEYQTVRTGSTFAVNGKESFTQIGMKSGTQAASRWGIKGVEDLGNGLKANFVYESGINATTGASSGFKRRSTLGLSSQSWGALDLGRRSSPGSDAFATIDPFESSYGMANLQMSMGTEFIRYSNMMMYTSPNWSGLTFGAGYSFDTQVGIAKVPASTNQIQPTGAVPFSFETNNRTRAISLAAHYERGPIQLAAIWDRLMAPASLALESSKIDAWVLGATYDFKVVKLHAAYGQQIGGVVNIWETPSDVGMNTGGLGDLTTALFAPGARSQSWMVGLSAPLSERTRVFTSVQQMVPGGSLKTSPIDQLSSQTIASVGVSHSLSRRTGVYAYYAYGNNMAMLNGVKVSTLAVGLRHSF